MQIWMQWAHEGEDPCPGVHCGETAADNKREIKGMASHINYEPQNSGRIHNMGRHDMEKLCALLALCEGNPPMTYVFPSQRTSNSELWYLRCC